MMVRGLLAWYRLSKIARLGVLIGVWGMFAALAVVSAERRHAPQAGPATGRSYTIAQVRAGLSNDPRDWNGAVILVLGYIGPLRGEGGIPLTADVALYPSRTSSATAPWPKIGPMYTDDTPPYAPGTWVTARARAWLDTVPACAARPVPQSCDGLSLLDYR